MKKLNSVAALALLLSAVVALGAVCTHVPAPDFPPLPGAAATAPISYREQVQPVLESA